MSTKLDKGNEWGEVIHSYSRKQAIDDGFLCDVSAMATEAGFKYPVALTHAVYEAYVTVPEGVSCQDEKGRLWDILVILAHYCRSDGTGGELRFSVLVRNDNRGPLPRKLKAVFHGGDDGEPVITVMLPDED